MKKKNAPDITWRKSFCGISGSAKVLNSVSSLSWNSHRVSVGRHFVTWEQSERSSDCRSDTKHVLCHLFRSPFTIDWPNGGEKKKLNTKQPLWLGLQMKPPLFCAGAPSLVPVACEAFVAAHKAAIVRKRRQRYSKSDRRSQSVPFQAADERKSERNYSEYECRKKSSVRPEDIKSIFFSFLNKHEDTQKCVCSKSAVAPLDVSHSPRRPRFLPGLLECENVCACSVCRV